jgi:hypothetical protein
VLGGDSPQAGEQRRGQALLLERVADDDGQLGELGIFRRPDEPGDAEDPLWVVGRDGDQRDVVPAVDVDEVVGVGARQVRLRGEKAPVLRFRRQPGIGGAQARAIVRPDRADHDLASTAQADHFHVAELTSGKSG